MFTTQPNASLPIYVDEAAQTVTVQAGVPQRLLLDFLANFTYVPCTVCMIDDILLIMT